MRRSIRGAQAFTVAEMMISMIGTSVIVGALLCSSMELQKSLHNGELYATCQADQQRLLDYVTRDLRRAIGISSAQSVGGSGGTRLAGSSVSIENDTSLVLLLPGYYQGNTPSDNNYDQALPVVAADNYVDYGTAGGHAPGVQVLFRKEYLAGEDCVCFVRQEGASEAIIVRHAENLHLQVTTAADGRNCSVQVSFQSPYSRSAPLVATRDQILLRNIRIDNP